jgi:hypothetical protein
VPTTRTVQTPSLAAAAPTVFTADATGDKFRIPDNGPVFLEIINGGGSSITATLDDPNSVTPEGAQSWNPDVQWTVPNGASRVVKIADARRFNNNAVDGLASIAWSAVTSVTFKLYA